MLADDRPRRANRLSRICWPSRRAYRDDFNGVDIHNLGDAIRDANRAIYELRAVPEGDGAIVEVRAYLIKSSG